MAAETAIHVMEWIAVILHDYLKCCNWPSPDKITLCVLLPRKVIPALRPKAT